MSSALSFKLLLVALLVLREIGTVYMNRWGKEWYQWYSLFVVLVVIWAYTI